MNSNSMFVLQAAWFLLVLTITGIPDWSASNMDSDVREFVSEVIDTGFLDEVLPYDEVIYVASDHKRAELSEDTIIGMLRYFQGMNGSGSVYRILQDGDGLARALGFKSDSVMQKKLHTASESGTAEQVNVHALIESQSRIDTSVCTVDSTGCTLSYSSVDNAVLDVIFAVSKPFSYDGKIYWIVCPGYSDYYFDGTYLFAYDMTDRRYTLKIHVDNLLSGDYTPVGVPVYVYSSEELCAMSNLEFGTVSRKWVSDAGINFNDAYNPYYSLDDVKRCASLFEEYLGYVPAELESLIE